MTHKQVEDYILSMPKAWLDYPFGEGVAVYKVGPKDDGKMFALMPEGKTPVSLSLKCDPGLSQLLREKYESVMEGYHLNKKHWNTILLTGQLVDQDIQDLICHSYNLVAKTGAETPELPTS